MSEQPPDTHRPESADEFGQLTGHNYDGIQEYDNPTPAWWTWVFLATVLFSACYMLVVIGTAGALSPEAEYQRADLANMKKKFGEIGTLEADAQTILSYMDDPEWLPVGEAVFKSRCVTCHGLEGQGNPAPSLVDDAYLHVRSIEDIAKIIDEGVVAKGMPAWGSQLHPNELVLVSSYVAALRGKDVGAGKAPEGDVISPWPTEQDDVEPSAEPEAAQ